MGYFVESVAWFNRGAARLQQPGDDSGSSGKGRDPNDPPDDGLLWCVVSLFSNDFTVTISVCCRTCRVCPSVVLLVCVFLL